jgi:hypothetical protein
LAEHWIAGAATVITVASRPWSGADHIFGIAGNRTLDALVAKTADNQPDEAAHLYELHSSLTRPAAGHGRARWWLASNARCGQTPEAARQPACTWRSTSATSSLRSRVPVRAAPPCMAAAFPEACDLKSSFKVDRCGLRFLAVWSGVGGGRPTRRRGLWKKRWCRGRRYPRSPGATAFRQACYSRGVDKHGRSKPRLCRVLPPYKLSDRSRWRKLRSHHLMSLRSRGLRHQAGAG